MFHGPGLITITVLSETTSVVQRSEFLATHPEVGVQFPALPDFLSGTGSTVSTIEELFERKISVTGLENRDYGRRDPSR
jgi:hypothetical protein